MNMGIVSDEINFSFNLFLLNLYRLIKTIKQLSCNSIPFFFQEIFVSKMKDNSI